MQTQTGKTTGGPPKLLSLSNRLSEAPKLYVNQSLKRNNALLNLPQGMITAASISTFSTEDILAIAPVQINNIDNLGPGSLYDSRMGESSPNKKCDYCHTTNCPGHYGYIHLPGLIYNPVGIRTIVQVLNSVCNTCSRILIPKNTLIERGIYQLPVSKQLQKIEELSIGVLCNNLLCSKTKKKPNSKEQPSANPEYILPNLEKDGVITYKSVTVVNTIKTVKESVLAITTVQNILRIIPEDDLKALGFTKPSSPSNLIINYLLIPPNTVRPRKISSGKSKDGFFTEIYKRIIKVTQSPEFGPLQASQTYQLYKQLVLGNPKKDSKVRFTRDPDDSVPILALTQGKEGAVRSLGLAKRQSNSSRAVLGGNPYIEFGWIDIPESWREILLKDIIVSKINYEYCRGLLRDGRVKYVISLKTGIRLIARQNKNPMLGDILKRHIHDGDYLIFNRNPTLSKRSITSVKGRLWNGSTERLPTTMAKTYNADFDGDEGSCFVSSRYQSIVENINILDIRRYIISGVNCSPIIALFLNSIIAVYLLSNEQLVPELFHKLISSITDDKALKTLWIRASTFNIDRYSGRVLISSLFPEDLYYDKNNIRIINGILVSGTMEASHVSTTSQSLIGTLLSNYGIKRTTQFLTDSSRVLGGWMEERAFTIGVSDIADIQLDENGNYYDRNPDIYKKIVGEGVLKIESLGEAVDDMGKRAQEMKISEIIKSIQQKVSEEYKKRLPKSNALHIMTDQGSGAKGNSVNVMNIITSVGQQFIDGGRFFEKITNEKRVLFNFDINDTSVEAHGFVKNSYFQGLAPYELYFIQASARETMIDTNLKTEEVGALYRRIVRASEDCTLSYDGTVRNQNGIIISFGYNCGYIPEYCVISPSNTGKYTLPTDISTLVRGLNAEAGYVPHNVNVNNDITTDYPEPSSESLDDAQIENYITIKDSTNKNYNRITRLEATAIVGLRSMMIAYGAPILLDNINNETDHINIATMEYEAGLLGSILSIKRKVNRDYYISVLPDATLV